MSDFGLNENYLSMQAQILLIMTMEVRNQSLASPEMARFRRINRQEPEVGSGVSSEKSSETTKSGSSHCIVKGFGPWCPK